MTHHQLGIGLYLIIRHVAAALQFIFNFYLGTVHSMSAKAFHILCRSYELGYQQISDLELSNRVICVVLGLTKGFYRGLLSLHSLK